MESGGDEVRWVRVTRLSPSYLSHRYLGHSHRNPDPGEVSPRRIGKDHLQHMHGSIPNELALVSRDSVRLSDCTTIGHRLLAKQRMLTGKGSNKAATH